MLIQEKRLIEKEMKEAIEAYREGPLKSLQVYLIQWMKNEPETHLFVQMVLTHTRRLAISN